MEKISARLRPRLWSHFSRRCIPLGNSLHGTHRVASQSNRVQPRPLRATNETAMTSDAQAILQSWSAPLGVNLALSLAALVYLRGWFRLHAALPTLFSAWRLTTFVAGVISVWVAIGSPVAAFDDI